MATTSGRDIILTLMADVAELQENSATTAGHLEVMAEHLDNLVKIARDNTKRTERIARTLAKLADLFKDHEDRITMLENRE
jgi:ABC-type transporter Mla subunit MlaD